MSVCTTCDKCAVLGHCPPDTEAQTVVVSEHVQFGGESGG